MKTSFYITAICLVSLSIFLMWSKFRVNDHDIAIAVNDDNDKYKFSASFPDSKTHAVEQYVNSSIAPNSLFKSENDYFDVTTTLTDQTEFYLKGKSGELHIEIDKRKNSNASIYRIRRMCDGVKNILTGNNLTNYKH
jgi:hypothetical protein